MSHSFIIEPLVHATLGLEEDYTRLDHYFGPLLWVGAAVLLINCTASVLGRSMHGCGLLRRSAVAITLLYLGVSLAIVAVLSARAFCVLISSGSITPRDIKLLRGYHLMWLFELTFCWGIGLVVFCLVTIASGMRALKRPRQQPPVEPPAP
jgi:hypothetical protein